MAAERKLIHEVLPVGWLQCNCSVLGDPVTREAIVVDPGDDISNIQEILAKHNLTVKYIVITHAHIDHVGGAAKLKRLTGAPILMNEEDRWLLENVEMQATLIGVPAPEVAEMDDALTSGQTIEWGQSFKAEVMHTPGHTPGSICLYLPEPEKILLAGDTLFAGSIGRTDLWGGSMDAIMRSLHGQVLSLHDDTRVVCGHGPETTIGAERSANPFLRKP